MHARDRGFGIRSEAPVGFMPYSLRSDIATRRVTPQTRGGRRRRRVPHPRGSIPHLPLPATCLPCNEPMFAGHLLPSLRGDTLMTGGPPTRISLAQGHSVTQREFPVVMDAFGFSNHGGGAGWRSGEVILLWFLFFFLMDVTIRSSLYWVGLQSIRDW